MADDNSALSMITLVQELRSEFDAKLANQRAAIDEQLKQFDERLTSIAQRAIAAEGANEALPELKGELAELSSQVTDLKRRMGSHDDARKTDHEQMAGINRAMVAHTETLATHGKTVDAALDAARETLALANKAVC